MTETKRRYAQIEKEALAATWACEKFSDYILGLHFTIESDHKPLIPLLNTKCLNCLPPRILRFWLRLARFSYTIHHVPGKLLYTADTLSRAPNLRKGDGWHRSVHQHCGDTFPASRFRQTGHLQRSSWSVQGSHMWTDYRVLQSWLAQKRGHRPNTSTILEGQRVTHHLLLLYNGRIHC